MFRMVNPQAKIYVCAGCLYPRNLQSMIFEAAGLNTGNSASQIIPVTRYLQRTVETQTHPFQGHGLFLP